MKRDGGITLLEILVALSILAFGLAAATRAGIAGSDGAMALRERQLALWVADNHLALWRASREWPALGQRQGEAEMGGQRFVWQARIAPVMQQQFRRVEFEVSPASRSDTPLVRQIAYLAKP